MNFLHALVNQKLRQLTPERLLELGYEYNISISHNEANLVVNKLKTTTLNIFDEHERMQLMQELSSITSPQTVAQVEAILMQKFGDYL